MEICSLYDEVKEYSSIFKTMRDYEMVSRQGLEVLAGWTNDSTAVEDFKDIGEFYDKIDDLASAFQEKENKTLNSKEGLQRLADILGDGKSQGQSADTIMQSYRQELLDFQSTDEDVLQVQQQLQPYADLFSAFYGANLNSEEGLQQIRTIIDNGELAGFLEICSLYDEVSAYSDIFKTMRDIEMVSRQGLEVIAAWTNDPVAVEDFKDVGDFYDAIDDLATTFREKENKDLNSKEGLQLLADIMGDGKSKGQTADAIIQAYRQELLDFASSDETKVQVQTQLVALVGVLESIDAQGGSGGYTSDISDAQKAANRDEWFKQNFGISINDINDVSNITGEVIDKVYAYAGSDDLTSINGKASGEYSSVASYLRFVATFKSSAYASNEVLVKAINTFYGITDIQNLAVSIADADFARQYFLTVNEPKLATNGIMKSTEAVIEFFLGSTELYQEFYNGLDAQGVNYLGIMLGEDLSTLEKLIEYARTPEGKAALNENIFYIQYTIKDENGNTGTVKETYTAQTAAAAINERGAMLAGINGGSYAGISNGNGGLISDADARVLAAMQANANVKAAMGGEIWPEFNYKDGYAWLATPAYSATFNANASKYGAFVVLKDAVVYGKQYGIYGADSHGYYVDGGSAKKPVNTGRKTSDGLIIYSINGEDYICVYGKLGEEEYKDWVNAFLEGIKNDENAKLYLKERYGIDFPAAGSYANAADIPEAFEEIANGETGARDLNTSITYAKEMGQINALYSPQGANYDSNVKALLDAQMAATGKDKWAILEGARYPGYAYNEALLIEMGNVYVNGISGVDESKAQQTLLNTQTATAVAALKDIGLGNLGGVYGFGTGEEKVIINGQTYYVYTTQAGVSLIERANNNYGYYHIKDKGTGVYNVYEADASGKAIVNGAATDAVLGNDGLYTINGTSGYQRIYGQMNETEYMGWVNGFLDAIKNDENAKLYLKERYGIDFPAAGSYANAADIPEAFEQIAYDVTGARDLNTAITYAKEMGQINALYSPQSSTYDANVKALIDAQVTSGKDKWAVMEGTRYPDGYTYNETLIKEMGNVYVNGISGVDESKAQQKLLNENTATAVAALKDIGLGNNLGGVYGFGPGEQTVTLNGQTHYVYTTQAGVSLIERASSNYGYYHIKDKGAGVYNIYEADANGKAIVNGAATDAVLGTDGLYTINGTSGYQRVYGQSNEAQMISDLNQLLDSLDEKGLKYINDRFGLNLTKTHVSDLSQFSPAQIEEISYMLYDVSGPRDIGETAKYFNEVGDVYNEYLNGASSIKQYIDDLASSKGVDKWTAIDYIRYPEKTSGGVTQKLDYNKEVFIRTADVYVNGVNISEGSTALVDEVTAKALAALIDNGMGIKGKTIGFVYGFGDGESTKTIGGTKYYQYLTSGALSKRESLVNSGNSFYMPVVDLMSVGKEYSFYPATSGDSYASQEMTVNGKKVTVYQINGEYAYIKEYSDQEKQEYIDKINYFLSHLTAEEIKYLNTFFGLNIPSNPGSSFYKLGDDIPSAFDGIFYPKNMSAKSGAEAVEAFRKEAKPYIELNGKDGYTLTRRTTEKDGIVIVYFDISKNNVSIPGFAIYPDSYKDKATVDKVFQIYNELNGKDGYVLTYGLDDKENGRFEVTKNGVSIPGFAIYPNSYKDKASIDQTFKVFNELNGKDGYELKYGLDDKGNGRFEITKNGVSIPGFAIYPDSYKNKASVDLTFQVFNDLDGKDGYSLKYGLDDKGNGRFEITKHGVSIPGYSIYPDSYKGKANVDATFEVYSKLKNDGYSATYNVDEKEYGYFLVDNGTVKMRFYSNADGSWDYSGFKTTFNDATILEGMPGVSLAKNPDGTVDYRKDSYGATYFHVTYTIPAQTITVGGKTYNIPAKQVSTNLYNFDLDSAGNVVHKDVKDSLNRAMYKEKLIAAMEYIMSTDPRSELGKKLKADVNKYGIDTLAEYIIYPKVNGSQKDHYNDGWSTQQLLEAYLKGDIATQENDAAYRAMVREYGKENVRIVTDKGVVQYYEITIHYKGQTMVLKVFPNDPDYPWTDSNGNLIMASNGKCVRINELNEKINTFKALVDQGYTVQYIPTSYASIDPKTGKKGPVTEYEHFVVTHVDRYGQTLTLDYYMKIYDANGKLVDNNVASLKNLFTAYSELAEQYGLYNVKPVYPTQENGLHPFHFQLFGFFNVYPYLEDGTFIFDYFDKNGNIIQEGKDNFFERLNAQIAAVKYNIDHPGANTGAFMPVTLKDRDSMSPLSNQVNDILEAYNNGTLTYEKLGELSQTRESKPYINAARIVLFVAGGVLLLGAFIIFARIFKTSLPKSILAFPMVLMALGAASIAYGLFGPFSKEEVVVTQAPDSQELVPYEVMEAKIKDLEPITEDVLDADGNKIGERVIRVAGEGIPGQGLRQITKEEAEQGYGKEGDFIVQYYAEYTMNDGTTGETWFVEYDNGSGRQIYESWFQEEIADSIDEWNTSTISISGISENSEKTVRDALSNELGDLELYYIADIMINAQTSFQIDENTLAVIEGTGASRTLSIYTSDGKGGWTLKEKGTFKFNEDGKSYITANALYVNQNAAATEDGRQFVSNFAFSYEEYENAFKQNLNDPDTGKFLSYMFDNPVTQREYKASVLYGDYAELTYIAKTIRQIQTCVNNGDIKGLQDLLKDKNTTNKVLIEQINAAIAQLQSGTVPGAPSAPTTPSEPSTTEPGTETSGPVTEAFDRASQPGYVQSIQSERVENGRLLVTNQDGVEAPYVSKSFNWGEPADSNGDIRTYYQNYKWVIENAKLLGANSVRTYRLPVAYVNGKIDWNATAEMLQAFEDAGITISVGTNDRDLSSGNLEEFIKRFDNKNDPSKQLGVVLQYLVGNEFNYHYSDQPSAGFDGWFTKQQWFDILGDSVDVIRNNSNTIVGTVHGEVPDAEHAQKYLDLGLDSVQMNVYRGGASNYNAITEAQNAFQSAINSSGKGEMPYLGFAEIGANQTDTAGAEAIAQTLLEHPEIGFNYFQLNPKTGDALGNFGLVDANNNQFEAFGVLRNAFEQLRDSADASGSYEIDAVAPRNIAPVPQPTSIFGGQAATPLTSFSGNGLNLSHGDDDTPGFEFDERYTQQDEEPYVFETSPLTGELKAEEMWALISADPEALEAFNDVFSEQLNGYRFKPGESFDKLSIEQSSVVRAILEYDINKLTVNNEEMFDGLTETEIQEKIAQQAQELAQTYKDLQAMGYKISTETATLAEIFPDGDLPDEVIAQLEKIIVNGKPIDLNEVEFVGVRRVSEQLGDNNIIYTIKDDAQQRNIVAIQFGHEGRIDSIKVNYEFLTKESKKQNETLYDGVDINSSLRGFDLVYGPTYGYEISGDYRFAGTVTAEDVLNGNELGRDILHDFDSKFQDQVMGRDIYDVMGVQEDDILVRSESTPRMQTGDGQYTSDSGHSNIVYVYPDGFVKTKEIITKYAGINGSEGDVVVVLWGLNQQNSSGEYQIEMRNENGELVTRDCPLGVEPGYFVVKDDSIDSTDAEELVVFRRYVGQNGEFNGEIGLEYDVQLQALKKNVIYSPSGKLLGERYLYVLAQLAAGIAGADLLESDGISGLETTYYNPNNMSFDQATTSVLRVYPEVADRLLPGWNTAEVQSQYPELNIRTEDGLVVFTTKSDYAYTFTTKDNAKDDNANLKFSDRVKVLLGFADPREQVVRVEVTESEGMGIGMKNRTAKIYSGSEMINIYGVDVVQTWAERSVGPIKIMAYIVGGVAIGSWVAGKIASYNHRKKMAKKDKKKPGDDFNGVPPNAGEEVGKFMDQLKEGNDDIINILIASDTTSVSAIRSRAREAQELRQQIQDLKWFEFGKRKALNERLSSANEEMRRIGLRSAGRAVADIAERAGEGADLKAAVMQQVQSSIPSYVLSWLNENGEIKTLLYGGRTDEQIMAALGDIVRANNLRNAMDVKEVVIRNYLEGLGDYGFANDTVKMSVDELLPKIMTMMERGLTISDITMDEIGQYMNPWLNQMYGENDGETAVRQYSLEQLFIKYIVDKNSHIFASTNGTIKYYMLDTIFKALEGDAAAVRQLSEVGNTLAIKKNAALGAIEESEAYEAATPEQQKKMLSDKEKEMDALFSGRINNPRDIALYVDSVVDRFTQIIMLNDNGIGAHAVMQGLSARSLINDMQDRITQHDVEDWFRTPEYIKWYEGVGRQKLDAYIKEQTQTQADIASSAQSIMAKAAAMKAADSGLFLPSVSGLINPKANLAQTIDFVNQLMLQQGKTLYSKVNEEKNAEVKTLLDMIDAFNGNNGKLKNFSALDAEKGVKKTHADLSGGRGGWKGVLAMAYNYLPQVFILVGIAGSAVAIVALSIMGMASVMSIAIAIIAVAAVAFSAYKLINQAMKLIIFMLQNKQNRKVTPGAESGTWNPLKSKTWNPLNPEDSTLVKEMKDKDYEKRKIKNSTVGSLVIYTIKFAWNILLFTYVAVPFLTGTLSTWPIFAALGAIVGPFAIPLMIALPIILFSLLDHFGVLYMLTSVVGYLKAKSTGVYSIRNLRTLRKLKKGPDGKQDTVFNLAMNRFKQYVLPKYITDEYGFKRHMTESEKDMAAMKQHNMLYLQLRIDDKISDDELKAYLYKIADSSGVERYVGVPGLETFFDQDLIISDSENFLKMPSGTVISPNLMIIPENPEAVKRLRHYYSTLFMDLESTPEWERMAQFSVCTPWNGEVIIYPWADKDIGDYEGLLTLHENGYIMLNEIIKDYPDEWINFVQRLSAGAVKDAQGNPVRINEQMKKDLESLLAPENRDLNPADFLGMELTPLVQEVRLWGSYRYQPMSRTIRGIMNYRTSYDFFARVNYPTASSLGVNQEKYDDEIFRRVGDKFEYVFMANSFTNDKKAYDAYIADPSSGRTKGADFYIDTLNTMARFPGCKAVVGIDGSQMFTVKTEGGIVQYDERGVPLIETLSTIRIDNPAYGQGKPIAQNSLFKFMRGEIVQMMDMNQDMDFEETFKQPGLMNMFYRSKSLVILGYPERVYTDKSPVGASHSFGDHTFAAMTQRVLAVFGVRFHYGHPDFVRKAAFVALGLIMPVNVNEDIEGAYKAILNGQKVEFTELLEAAKGREGVLGGFWGINNKFGSGGMQQAMTRLVARINKAESWFSRALFHGNAGIGFYLKQMIVPATIFSVLLIVNLLGLSPFVAVPSVIVFGLLAILQSQAITIPGFVQIIVEDGLGAALMKFAKVLPSLTVSYAAIDTNAVYAGVKAGTTGKAAYKKTGRIFGRAHVPLYEEGKEDVNADLPATVYGWGAKGRNITSMMSFFILGSILLWANVGIWWSVPMFIIPIMSVVGQAIVNPGGTPVDTKVDDWNKTMKEDIKISNKKFFNYRTWIPLGYLVGAVALLFAVPALTTWIIVAFVAVYLGIGKIIPGLFGKIFPKTGAKIQNAYNGFAQKHPKLEGIAAIFTLPFFGYSYSANMKASVDFKESFNLLFNMVTTYIVMWTLSAAAHLLTEIGYFWNVKVRGRSAETFERAQLDKADQKRAEADNHLKLSTELFQEALELTGKDAKEKMSQAEKEAKQAKKLTAEADRLSKNTKFFGAVRANDHKLGYTAVILTTVAVFLFFGISIGGVAIIALFAAFSLPIATLIYLLLTYIFDAPLSEGGKGDADTVEPGPKTGPDAGAAPAAPPAAEPAKPAAPVAPVTPAAAAVKPAVQAQPEAKPVEKPATPEAAADKAKPATQASIPAAIRNVPTVVAKYEDIQQEKTKTIKVKYDTLELNDIARIAKDYGINAVVDADKVSVRFAVGVSKYDAVKADIDATRKTFSENSAKARKVKLLADNDYIVRGTVYDELPLFIREMSVNTLEARINRLNNLQYEDAYIDNLRTRAFNAINAEITSRAAGRNAVNAAKEPVAGSASQGISVGIVRSFGNYEYIATEDVSKGDEARLFLGGTAVERAAAEEGISARSKAEAQRREGYLAMVVIRAYEKPATGASVEYKNVRVMPNTSFEYQGKSFVAEQYLVENADYGTYDIQLFLRGKNRQDTELAASIDSDNFIAAAFYALAANINGSSVLQGESRGFGIGKIAMVDTVGKNNVDSSSIPGFDGIVDFVRYLDTNELGISATSDIATINEAVNAERIYNRAKPEQWSACKIPSRMKNTSRIITAMNRVVTRNEATALIIDANGKITADAAGVSVDDNFTSAAYYFKAQNVKVTVAVDASDANFEAVIKELFELGFDGVSLDVSKLNDTGVRSALAALARLSKEHKIPVRNNTVKVNDRQEGLIEAEKLAGGAMLIGDYGRDSKISPKVSRLIKSFRKGYRAAVEGKQISQFTFGNVNADALNRILDDQAQISRTDLMEFLNNSGANNVIRNVVLKKIFSDSLEPVDQEREALIIAEARGFVKGAVVNYMERLYLNALGMSLERYVQITNDKNNVENTRIKDYLGEALLSRLKTSGSQEGMNQFVERLNTLAMTEFNNYTMADIAKFMENSFDDVVNKNERTVAGAQDEKAIAAATVIIASQMNKIDAKELTKQAAMSSSEVVRKFLTAA